MPIEIWQQLEQFMTSKQNQETQDILLPIDHKMVDS